MVTTPSDSTFNQWKSVCWAPELGLFCAVGYIGAANNQQVMTSSDGTNWNLTSVNGAASYSWKSVCWAPEIGLFCAVANEVGTSGSTQLVLTSPDAATWTFRSAADSSDWNSVCWAPELGFFVAVSSSSTAMCSLPAQPVVYSATNAVYFPSVGTTASAANTFLSSTSVPANQLLRATSSLRYKTDVEDLDAAKADAVLQLRPVWYRSLADADKPEWSWYGLIAEEVATVEPRLVHYATDGEGNLIPDGVQYDRLGVLMLDVIQRDKAKMDDLEARLFALENS